MQTFLKFISIFVLFTACNSYKQKYPYSLKDFNPELRRHLVRIVENGGLCDEKIESDLNFLTDSSSVNDLQKLTLAEIPLLRVAGFSGLCNKGLDRGSYHLASDLEDSGYDVAQRINSKYVDNILLSHLDDTSFITYCGGELVYNWATVSDRFIDISSRHTSILKTHLSDLIIREHPYLEHFGSFLLRDTTSKHNSLIKEFITKKHRINYYDKYALIEKLSKYKNNSDTNFIANELKENWRDMEDQKFDIIENNPIQNYFFVIEKFYKELLKNDEKRRLQEVFWNEKLLDFNFDQAFGKFITATISFKTKRSAEILSNILDKKLYKRAIDSKSNNDFYPIYFKFDLIKDLKKYNCAFYNNIIKKLEKETKNFKPPFADPLPEATKEFSKDYYSSYW